MTLRFQLHRKNDTTGVSGTGHVADGVRFGDGTCVIRWRTSAATTTTYARMEDVRAIHCHNGDTRVEWVDDCFWGQRDLRDNQEAVDKSLPMLRAEPFNRGKFDCMMDGNENVPFASVGGLDKRAEPLVTPDYVPEADRKAYLEGYRDQAWAQYGPEWRTCSFGWHHVMTIGPDGIEAATS